MKSLKLAAMVLLTCVVSATASAQRGGMDLLRQMEAKFGDVKGVAGSFTQSAYDPVFKTNTVTPANFQLLKPSFFRAVYQAKAGQKPMVQLISDRMYYQYIPAHNQVQTYKFKGDTNVRDLNYLLLGFGAKASEVAKVYNVSALEDGNGVLLKPKNPAEASFKHIAMEVDPQSLLPTQFTMRQPDNSDMTVRINTGSLQINPSLSPSDFRPNFGNAVQVPLD